MADQVRPPAPRDILFCPFCFQQQFPASAISGLKVYCEICGVDVEVKELVKP
jgi:hypothetical protein